MGRPGSAVHEIPERRHIGGQLLLARLWLIPSDGLGYFVPLFLAAAFVSGTVNGIICARLLTETRPDDAPA